MNNNEQKPVKVLCLGGPTAESLALQAYPEGEIDVQNKLTTRKTNYYDVVISYHDLQKQSQRDTVDYLKKVRRTMVDHGSFNLFVPALEWIADELFKEEPSPVTLLALFGNQKRSDEYHKSGYTMRLLRRDLALAGFAVSHANQGLYEVQWVGEDGQLYSEDVGQNIVIARKRTEEENVPYTKIKG